MDKYCVYMLKCNDGHYYTGVTNNIEERMFQHKSGFNKHCYTFYRRPVELVFTAYFDDIWDAIKAEKQIQGWSRKKKEALIKNDWNRIQDLSKNKKNRDWRV